MDHPAPSKRHHRYLAALSRFETDGSARRGGQPAPVGRLPVETEGKVHLEEMGVRPHLHWTVAGVVYSKGHHVLSAVQFYLPLGLELVL